MIKKKGKVYDFPELMVHPGTSTGTLPGGIYNIKTIPILFRADSGLVKGTGNWESLWGGLNPNYFKRIRADAQKEKEAGRDILVIIDGTTMLKMTPGEEAARFGGHLFYTGNGGPFAEAPQRNYFSTKGKVREAQKALIKGIVDKLKDIDNIYFALMWELFTYIRQSDTVAWAKEMLQVLPEGRRGLGLHEKEHLEKFPPGTFGINEGANPMISEQEKIDAHPVIQVGWQVNEVYFYRSRKSGKQDQECKWLTPGNEQFVIDETCKTWLYMMKKGLHMSYPFERFTKGFGGRTITKCEQAGYDIKKFDHLKVRQELTKRLRELLATAGHEEAIKWLENKWFGAEPDPEEDTEPLIVVPPPPTPNPPPEEKKEEVKMKKGTFDKIAKLASYGGLWLMVAVTWIGGGAHFAVLMNAIVAALMTGIQVYKDIR